jgi:hypothetical protein
MASGIGEAYGSVWSREKLLYVPSAKYDLQRLCNHFRLVVRFRPELAARLDANFGIKGPLVWRFRSSHHSCGESEMHF